MGLIDALVEVSKAVDVKFSYRPTRRDPADELVLEAAYTGPANIYIQC